MRCPLGQYELNSTALKHEKILKPHLNKKNTDGNIINTICHDITLLSLILSRIAKYIS
jgi:hypothetical protein